MDHAPAESASYLYYRLFLTVQDGGKTGANTGIKLAYRHVFAPVFTSDSVPPRVWTSDASCPAQGLARRYAVLNCFDYF